MAQRGTSRRTRLRDGSFVEQRTDQWYSARAGKITGSRFAYAMAARGTTSFRQLIDQLVQERLTGRCLDNRRLNSAMQWGIDHEDAARHWYSKAYGRSVDLAGFVVHPDFDYVGVSPDGLVGLDGVVEIKCPQRHNFQKVRSTRRMPSQYRWQVQGQLWVCRRDWADFVCFHPPSSGVVIRVERDSADAERLEERCREINQLVEGRMGSARRSVAPVAASNTRPVITSSLEEGVPRSRNDAARAWPVWSWVLLIVGLIACWKILL